MRSASGVLCVGLLMAGSAQATTTIYNGSFIEDFGDAIHYDYANSTGLWNVGAQQLQAKRGATNGGFRAIDFGDGSLGSVTSSIGYTFDTNAYPNGFNFVHLTITGGTITVTGSNPLIIRALGNISISPTISVTGGTGQNGVASASSPAPAGGTPVACAAYGGSGGLAGANGSDGTLSNGAADTGSAGIGNSGGTPGGGAGSALDGPGAASNFDITSAFTCGGGGGGGGGHSTTSHTGGGGGAGGGAIRIIAAGTLTVGTVQANGGAGGAGAGAAVNSSGGGSGGNGGAIWLQTLSGSITSTSLTVAGGALGAGPNGTNNGFAGSAGVVRQDHSAGGTVPAPTANVVVGSYMVTSLPYDLGTGNYAILSAPALTQTLPLESTVQFAGSSERDANYTAWTTDPTTLSDRGFRYLKLRAIISPTTTTTPTISMVRLSYAELGVQLRGGACAPALGSKRSGPLPLRALPLLVGALFAWTAVALAKPKLPGKR